MWLYNKYTCIMHKCKGLDLTAAQINGKIIVEFRGCSMRPSNCSYS